MNYMRKQFELLVGWAQGAASVSLSSHPALIEAYADAIAAHKAECERALVAYRALRRA